MGKLYDSLPDDLGLPPEWWEEHWKTHPKPAFFVQGSFVGSELAPEVLTFRREVIHGGARSFDDFLANVARLGRRARRKKPARHLSARHLGWG